MADAQSAAKQEEEAQVGAAQRGIAAVQTQAKEHLITDAQELAGTKALLAAE